MEAITPCTAMKNNHFSVLLTLILFSLSTCTQPEAEVIELNLNYNPSTIELFGEDIISTPFYERDIAISADGNEIIRFNAKITVRNLINDFMIMNLGCICLEY